MPENVMLGDVPVGRNRPVYIIAEIGINHNGSVDIAKKLVDAAALAGADAVKFQKRTPDLCVPENQRDVMRETPWGRMTYLEYRHRVEFDKAEFSAINDYCRNKGIAWFASCWDEPSVEFIEGYDPICYKIASASITDTDLLRALADTGRPLILSTGMSTMDEINTAYTLLPKDRLIILHSTSTYPCPVKELNLRMITTLQGAFDCPIGYSGHEVGLATTYAAVALGACVIERHITLDRASWGSDQAASIEPWGLMRLVRDIRAIEDSIGDGVKRIYDSERPSLDKLRRQIH